MKDKLIIYVSIIVLVLSTIVGTYLYNRNVRKNMDLQIVAAREQISQLFDGFIEREMAQFKLSNMELKGCSNVLDRLKDLCMNDTLFVFCFGETSCEPCIDAAFTELSAFTEFAANKRFLIVTHFKDRKRFEILSNLYKDKYFFINAECDSGIYIDEANKYLPPVFFILNNGKLYPQKLFFYPKELPQLNKKYFRLILDMYFNK
jgi:hypothetical protein